MSRLRLFVFGQYKTGIGEHGAGLRGGRKLRFAIASARIKRSKILIFDEATNKLIEETANVFGQEINAFKH